MNVDKIKGWTFATTPSAKESELRSPKPEFNNGKDMALARIALQKAVLQRKLKTCEF